MSKTFKLPDLGEGVHEAEILAILVSSGESIEEGNPLLEVETDKAAVVIPSPFTAIVQSIAVQVGDIVSVGQVLITFGTSSTVGTKKMVNKKKTPVPASPSTRKLARELGVDLQEVSPSGTAGRVTREDVQAHHGKAPQHKETATQEIKELESRELISDKAERVPATNQDFSQWGPVERVPFHSVRRATANQMTRSWNQIPHVHCQDNVDITDLETFRQKHKNEIEKAGGRLTMTIFAMKAVATALKNFPFFNASLDLGSQEIVMKHYFNIGIAVDTEKGLMVPVIKDVDRKSIKELSIELHNVTSAARAGSMTREDMQGGTFTITNAGALGGSHFSAIINHPEVAILGLGQGRMQPTVITDQRREHKIVPRLIMPIVLCFDHRVVDGGDSIRFLRLIIDALEDPDELLITMI